MQYSTEPIKTLILEALPLFANVAFCLGFLDQSSLIASIIIVMKRAVLKYPVGTVVFNFVSACDVELFIIITFSTE
jgi:hypothetical protein